MAFAFSSTVKIICLLVTALVLIGSTLLYFLTQNGSPPPQNTSKYCLFDLMYHLGDGVFDTGNAIANMSQLPAANRPYGKSYPGTPTGRWSDGLTYIDYGARGLGYPEVTTYSSGNATSSNAIVFAVARSPVLDRSFFTARGISIPPYAASLSTQMSWFRDYLATICVTQEDCADKLSNSVFNFGDVEANDITYGLIQGKSIKEVQNYVRYITEAQINAAREVIKMGATRIILPGNAPIGCYPFILTELATKNASAYDELGCLMSVNDLMVFKNNDLRDAIDALREEFPDIFIHYADFYATELALLRQVSTSRRLKACCGSGGRYDYNRGRFCGSVSVRICYNPTQYFFWDGIHLTQEANRRLSVALQREAMAQFNCKVPLLTEPWSYI